MADTKLNPVDKELNVIDFGRWLSVPFPVPVLESDSEFDKEMRYLLGEIERKIDDMRKEKE